MMEEQEAPMLLDEQGNSIKTNPVAVQVGVALTEKKDSVIIAFSQPTTVMTMTKEQATNYVGLIQQHVDQIEEETDE